MNLRQFAISDKYRQSIKYSVIFQVACLLAALMMMDGGRCTRFVVLAMFAYWVGLLIMVLRRPQSPTRADLALASIGFLLLLFVIAPLWAIVANLLGRQVW